VTNSFIITVPQGDIITRIQREAIARVAKLGRTPQWDNRNRVLKSTGPYMMTDLYNSKLFDRPDVEEVGERHQCCSTHR
jgi:hypothetical protein